MGYIKNNIPFQVLSVDNRDNLEIFSLFIPLIGLLVISIYFPHGNNAAMNDIALDYLFQVVQFTKNKVTAFNYNISLIGDLKIKNVVKFDTRRISP